MSTGLGSTGWMTSVIVGSLNIGAAWQGARSGHAFRAISYRDFESVVGFEVV